MIPPIPGLSEDQVALVLSSLRKQLSTQPILTSYDTVIDYLHGLIAHCPQEQFVVLYLDRKNRLITITQTPGTVDHVPVYPREVARHAILNDASAVILAHNHPSGDPTPSDADKTMTRSVLAALDTLGIVLHDHIIIGHSNEISFRSKGYL